MRVPMIFVSLALVGSIFSPQAVEGQYPFLDPKDPCYMAITYL